MIKVDISQLQEKNYEEGAQILKELGYHPTEKNVDTDGLAQDASIKEIWQKEDHTVCFEWYYDGDITEEVGWWETCSMKEMISAMKKEFEISRAELAKQYDVPVRTMQDWDLEKAEPAEYIRKLFERSMKQDIRKKRGTHRTK